MPDLVTHLSTNKLGLLVLVVHNTTTRRLASRPTGSNSPSDNRTQILTTPWLATLRSGKPGLCQRFV